jgi:hypothetical protein
MNSFVIKQHKLINRIKYYATKILFPIYFIDIFKSKIHIHNNMNGYDAPKIYEYLNNYNKYIIDVRIQLVKLKEIVKWGLLYNSYVVLKVRNEYLIKMINMYTNLILKFIINNKKTNKIYDISYINYLKKDDISLFMKIYKIENKYILIHENYISSVSPSFIDTLFPTYEIHNYINYPLHLCDQIDYSEKNDRY